jgi:hypothetical protein
MPVLVGAVAGAIGTPLILAKSGMLAKLPGVVGKTGKVNTTIQAVYSAGIGVVLGGLLAKFAGKKFGYSFAMGAAIVPIAGLVATKVPGLSGLGWDYDLQGGAYDMQLQGGAYDMQTGGISELDGIGAITELDGLGAEIPELEGF